MESLEARTLLAAGPAHGADDVVVAVIDSGIDYTHPLLREHVWTNAIEVAGDQIDNDGNGYVDDVRGWDWSANDNDVRDEFWHGTHVAGTVVLESQRALAKLDGAAAVKVLGLKFLDGSGGGTIDNALAAFNYAVDLKVRHGVNIRVINNSWGGGSLFSQAFFDAMKRAQEAGILVVSAAGNGGADIVGDDNDVTPSYPANYEVGNVLSVAAVDGKALAGFSNFGAKTVDLAAPGVGIVSTLPGGKTGAASGTSMAAPQVSAVAAVAWALRPAATVESIRASIVGNVKRLAGLEGRVVSGGMLDAAETLAITEAVTSVEEAEQVAQVEEAHAGEEEATEDAAPALDDEVIRIAMWSLSDVAVGGEANNDSLFQTSSQILGSMDEVLRG